jgi:uncharacterized phage protein (TIGR02218 family)
MAKDVSTQLENLENRRTRKPVDIYDIWNTSYQYNLTSADEPITYDGNVYTPSYIGRGGTQHDTGLQISKCTVTIDYLQTEVQRYLQSAPLDLTWVRVMKIFRNQPIKEAMVYFIGTVSAVSFRGHAATLMCDGLEKALMQPVPRIRYQRLCPHSLYDAKCGLTQSNYAGNATLSAMSANGLTLTSADFSSMLDLSLGWLEFAGFKRMIASHTTTTIVIRHQIPGLTGTSPVVVYPGCDKTMETCITKFSNMNGSLDRYGGFPYIPFDNPTVWA